MLWTRYNSHPRKRAKARAFCDTVIAEAFAQAVREGVCVKTDEVEWSAATGRFDRFTGRSHSKSERLQNLADVARAQGLDLVALTHTHPPLDEVGGTIGRARQFAKRDGALRSPRSPEKEKKKSRKGKASLKK